MIRLVNNNQIKWSQKNNWKKNFIRKFLVRRRNKAPSWLGPVKFLPVPASVTIYLKCTYNIIILIENNWNSYYLALYTYVFGVFFFSTACSIQIQILKYNRVCDEMHVYTNNVTLKTNLWKTKLILVLFLEVILRVFVNFKT